MAVPEEVAPVEETTKLRVNTIVQQAAIEHINGEDGCKPCMSRALNHELGNEHVRTDKELREAAMSIANVSSVFEKLVDTLEEQLTGYTKKAKQLYDLETAIAIKRKEITELKAMEGLKTSLSIGHKIAGVITAIVIFATGMLAG